VILESGHCPMIVHPFYAFYAWWFHFPQSGALAEGTSRPISHKHDQLEA
jgi:hypothetical protein